MQTGRRTVAAVAIIALTTLLPVATSTIAAAALPPESNVSGALIDSPDCTENPLTRNDDGSTSQVQLPFPVDFYGNSYDRLWVNNNGNVTFEGPLGTYTPFGLQDAGLPIIAPFFADVDTRGSGSEIVRYGWGQTTYEGHRAFCVNWVNVGYYSSHYDKLNSFQLLLVEREDIRPGDFDIVFNYGTIKWETGDASGGSNGFGGRSARVGFSNGDATVGSSYELPGSGISGYLLDTSASGLIHGSQSSSQLGRYLYAIRNGQPAPNTYVAMGDSYQSGVGGGDYDPATDYADNHCMRSRNAHPELLTRDGRIPYTLNHIACGGASIQDIRDGMFNEGSQLDDLNKQTALVTLGVGGNDPFLGSARELHHQQLHPHEL